MSAGTIQFDYLRQMWNLRYFWFSLVRNDLRSRYRRSVLGIGWSLLRPIGMTAVFCLVFGSIFQEKLTTFAPYVLLGMTTWQFLVESINIGCHSFTIGGAYIRQQKIPHAIFPLRIVLAASFHFSVALALAIGLVCFFQVFFPPDAAEALRSGGGISWAALLALPPALILLFLLGWSLAIISGVAQTHFPDTSHLLEIVLQILFYLSPIMYNPDRLPGMIGLKRVMAWNPVHAILDLIRQPILKGQIPPLESVLVVVAAVAIAGSLAIYLLRRLERSLVFWL